MAQIELYGAIRCPHTQEIGEWLEQTGREFEEYDVEADPEARRRMQEISGGIRNIPVLIEDGKVIQVGWRGQGCVVE